MASDKPKIEAKIITIHEGRISFYRGYEAKYRTDKFGREVTKRPDGTPAKPQYRFTWLLDPSNAQAAATIKEIKDEASRQLDIYFNGRENWPKDNQNTGTKGVLTCFGEGNKQPKVYDGYKDMFFIKVGTNAGDNIKANDLYAAAGDSTAPIIGDRRGRHVKFLSDNAWHVVDKATGQTTDEVIEPGLVPYGGAFCRGRIKLYVYNNESAGVNANWSGLQFLRPGPAFGGGAKRSAADELAEMAGDAPASAAGTTEQDPFAV